MTQQEFEEEWESHIKRREYSEFDMNNPMDRLAKAFLKMHKAEVKATCLSMTREEFYADRIALEACVREIIGRTGQ